MSGSYYGSYLNQRIFREIKTLIVGGINDLGFFLRYMPWNERVDSERGFLGLIV